MKKIFLVFLFFLSFQMFSAEKKEHTFIIDDVSETLLSDFREIEYDREGRIIKEQNLDSLCTFEYFKNGCSYKAIIENNLQFNEKTRETKYLFVQENYITNEKKQIYYDKNKRIYKIKTNIFTIKYEYEDSGIIKECYDTGDVFYYFFDEKNEMQKIHDLSSFIIKYDKKNNITYYSANGIEYFAEYDLQSRLIYSKKIYGINKTDFTEQTYKYDKKGHLVFFLIKYVIKDEVMEEKCETIYDEDGRVLEQGNESYKQYFDYDENGQIVKVKYVYEGWKEPHYKEYKYDENKNLVYECSTEENNRTIDYYTYNENNELILRKRVYESISLEEDKIYLSEINCYFDIVKEFYEDGKIKKIIEYSAKKELY